MIVWETKDYSRASVDAAGLAALFGAEGKFVVSANWKYPRFLAGLAGRGDKIKKVCLKWRRVRNPRVCGKPIYDTISFEKLMRGQEISTKKRRREMAKVKRVQLAVMRDELMVLAEWHARQRDVALAWTDLDERREHLPDAYAHHCRAEYLCGMAEARAKEGGKVR